MRSGAVLAFVVYATTTALAHADGDDARKERCATSYEGGQRTRSDGKLLAARDAFRVCARDCSVALGKQCAEWLEQVEHEIPTIVLSVEGSDRSDVRVYLDGTSLRDSLDGRPIEVDPGPHTVRFVTLDGKTSAEKAIVVRAAERLQAVTLPLVSPGATGTPPVVDAPKRVGFPWYSGVFAGLAIAGVGVGTGTWISGRVMESDLSRAGCAPYCDPSLVEPIDLRYQIGAVAFGIAAVTLAATFISYALRPTRHE